MFNRHPLRLRLACAAVSLLLCPLAWSAAPGDIQSLIEKGAYQEALAASNAALEVHPQDAELRFLRGLALAELGEVEAAIEAFGELARDYPDRPEPANNLAVLYARQGDYESAREWLEAAMQTHPAYATAHRNLGDIYTALAAMAYSKALQQGDQPEQLAVQLDLVSRLYTDRRAPRMVAAPARVPEPAAAPAAPQPETETGAPELAVAPAAPQPETETGAPELAAAPAAPQPETETGPPAPADPAPGEAEAPAPVPPAGVLAAVRAWADAWAAQDAAAYLDAYAANFDPLGDRSRAQWAALRRERVAAPAWIEVEVRAPKVVMESEDRVRVMFEQAYRSDSYHDRVRKTLVLTRTEQGWRILRETDVPL